MNHNGWWLPTLKSDAPNTPEPEPEASLYSLLSLRRRTTRVGLRKHHSIPIAIAISNGLQPLTCPAPRPTHL
jgi:hypothetical protein